MFCIVVGAGPAGLAASHELQLRRVSHVVLERNNHPGSSWSSLYDSVRMHSGKRMSALPGMPFRKSDPEFIPRDRFVEYMREYARTFSLPIEFGVDVTSARRSMEGWTVSDVAGRSRDARALAVATGIMANPLRPRLRGEESFQGRILHSIEYRNPAAFAGCRVLVVGVGNSGAEISVELAGAGIPIHLAVRSGANVVPRELLGIPVQYISHYVHKLPRVLQELIVAVVRGSNRIIHGDPGLKRLPVSPLDEIPVIGLSLSRAIRAGSVLVRPGIEQLTERGAVFTDRSVGEYDVIILATGFRPSLDLLGGSVRVDDRGLPVTSDAVRSRDDPTLFFIGMRHETTGALNNIAQDAPLLADHVAALSAPTVAAANAGPHGGF